MFGAAPSDPGQQHFQRGAQARGPGVGQVQAFDVGVTAKIARKKARVYEVGSSYSGLEYSEG